MSFFKKEMSIRRELSYSPYYFMTSIKIISKDYELARTESVKVGEYLKSNLENTIILGPSIANVFRINNTYRFNIILKYKKDNKLYETLLKLQEHYASNSKVKVDIDINPVNI